MDVTTGMNMVSPPDTAFIETERAKTLSEEPALPLSAHVSNRHSTTMITITDSPIAR